MRTIALQEHGADRSRRIRWALSIALVSKVPMFTVAVVGLVRQPSSYAGQSTLAECWFLLGKSELASASCEWTLWLQRRNIVLQLDRRFGRATGRRTQ
jgi:hypothetical protein